MASRIPYLSIVIPAFNEAENVTKNRLASLFSYLKHFTYPYEVVIVDDGSSDDTLQSLKEISRKHNEVRVIQNPHQGKALTVKTGVDEAQGKLLIYTDFDQSTPISEIEKLLPFIDKGYHVVIGSREVKGSKREEEPWYRHLMGKGFNLIVQLFTISGIQDTQCGFKLLDRQVAVELFNRMQVTLEPKPDAFTGAFDVEMLYLAQKFGYRIAEVPVHWQHAETIRINPVKDSVRMLQQVLAIRVHDLLGRYGS